jgi:hypothetical protein
MGGGELTAPVGLATAAMAGAGATVVAGSVVVVVTATATTESPVVVVVVTAPLEPVVPVVVLVASAEQPASSNMSKDSRIIVLMGPRPYNEKKPATRVRGGGLDS